MKKVVKKMSVLLLILVMLLNTACYKIPQYVVEQLLSDQATQEPDNIIRYTSSDKPRLEDDFYANVNYDILMNAELSAGNSQWSVLSETDLWISVDLYRISLELNENQGTYQKGTPEQRIADFQTTIADYKGRNKNSISAMKSYLSGIEKASNVEEYIQAAGDLFQTYGFSSLIYFYIAPDAADSTKNAAWMDCSDIVLEREIFMEEDMEADRELYRNYMKDMFVLYGYDKNTAQKKMEAVYNLQYEIAKAGLSTTESGKPENYYNPMTLSELKALMPGVDVELMLRAFGMDNTDMWIVSDKGAIAKMSEYLRDENLQVLKDFSTFIYMNDTSDYSSIDIRDTAVQYMMDKYGATGFPEDEDLDADVLLNTMTWDFGKIYIDNFFSEDMKKDIIDITEEILATYEDRIDMQEWMSDATKEKAKKKLETMTLKIGYPDKWPESIDKVDIISASDGGLLLDNYMNQAKATMEGYIDCLGKEVDKTEWEMPPQTVNAYYLPSANEIVFPAGILQEPFYSPEYTRAQNLGGIGMIIGHEITHAFDDSGSLYDENGNYNVWWTDEELEEFKRLQKEIEDYYNNFEIESGYYVNGELTLSENTSDLGSLNCITQIIGDNPEELRQMYQSFAVCWAEISTKEAMINALKTDSHSPAKARVNAVLSNTDGFYQAFDIDSSDKMYVPKENRVGIW